MAFSRLNESIKKTTSIADGYKLGRLVFEEENNSWVPYIETGNEVRMEYIEVDGYIVEVLNDEKWHRMTEDDYERVTAEGWPLFGGFDCRFKKKE